MSDKRIKHFVVMRFFTGQNPKYPHNIYDTSFLATQLPLVKNALRSLENQTNKNFELVFTVNWKFFGHPKYDFIFSALKASTILPIRFISDGNKDYLLEEALKAYDFVIHSSMDFDDFLYKDGIADTQSKIEECNNILAYGYCKGYEYINGDLYPYFNTFNSGGTHSILFSTIAKSSAMKSVPRFYHHVLKKNVKEFVERSGMTFSEDMFQQNTSANAFIYFRHEFSQDQLVIYGTPEFKVLNRSPLTTKDITKKQLEEEFGFFYDLNSIK